MNEGEGKKKPRSITLMEENFGRQKKHALVLPAPSPEHLGFTTVVPELMWHVI